MNLASFFSFIQEAPLLPVMGGAHREERVQRTKKVRACIQIFQGTFGQKEGPG